MKPYQIFSILILLVFTPSITFVSLGASSLAPGLSISSIIIFACLSSFVFLRRFSFSSLIVCACILFFLLGLPAISSAFHDQFKPLISLGLLFLVFVSSIALSIGMSITSYDSLSRGLTFFVCLLLCLGWFDIIFSYHFGAYALREKPVFPFSEQSHYALSVGLFAGPAFVRSNRTIKTLVIFNFLLQGFLFPNLSMLVFCGFLGYLFFIIDKPKLLFCISVLFLFFCFYFFYIGADFVSTEGYFSSRLNVSAESQNLTTLVFLQGWEQAMIALKESNGLGVGFQMLGSESPGVFAGVINSVTGDDLNREDGGLLVAKIIGEFGVFGILLSFFYLFFFLKIALKCKLIYSSERESEKKKIIYYSFFIMFFVELFFRGYGYFSPGFVVFLASIFSLRSHIGDFRKII